jgi:hypothetical protein
MPQLPALTSTALVNIIIGALLLILGRRLFWLFVGLVGFLSGFNLAPQLLPNQPDWVILLAAIVVGLLGALLAIVLQRVAAGIAGFLAGGYLLNNLLVTMGVDLATLWWITYIIGGVIGFILVIALFDWALIILSSLIGAQLIVQSLVLASDLAILVFIVLLLVGIAVQAGWMRTYRPVDRRVRRVD